MRKASKTKLAGFMRQVLGNSRSTFGSGCGVTSRPDNDRDADNHRANARHLCVAHAEVNWRVDANELHQKTSHPGEHQVFAGDLAGIAAASLPQDGGDDEGDDELIDGGGMDTLHG